MHLHFLSEYPQGLKVKDGLPLISFKRNSTIKPFQSIKKGGLNYVKILWGTVRPINSQQHISPKDAVIVLKATGVTGLLPVIWQSKLKIVSSNLNVYISSQESSLLSSEILRCCIARWITTLEKNKGRNLVSVICKRPSSQPQFAIICVKSFCFSCPAGPEEEEALGAAAHPDRWHAVHHRVSEGSSGELAHQHRGPEEHGLRC